MSKSALAFLMFSLVVNAVMSLGLALFVLLKANALKVNRYFAYLCLVTGIMFTVYFLEFYCLWRGQLVMAEYWQRTLMIFVFLIPPILFQFTMHFLNRPVPLWVTIANYLVALSGPLFIYTPAFAYDFRLFNGLYWLKSGPLFYPMFSYFVGNVLYVLFMLYRNYKSTVKSTRKEQIRLVYLAFLIGFVTGCAGFLMWLNIPLKPYSTILVSLYVLIIAYAVLKHQFLNIPLIIKNSLIYTTAMCLITLAYFALIYVFEHQLRGIMGYQSVLVSLGITLLLAGLFIPLQEFLRRVIEKYLFKGTAAQFSEHMERIQQEMILSERYKTFSDVVKSLTVAIKEPLMALKNYNAEYQQHLDDKMFLERFAQVLDIEIQKIENLVEGLDKYSHPEPLRMERTDMYALLTDLLDEMRPLLNSQKISITKSFDDHKVFYLNVDLKQIRQALMSVVEHTLKTMPEGGHLYAEVEHKENDFVIFLKDTGKPIPDAQIEKVFDPFSQYHGQEPSMELAIAFSIIKNHGGKIFVNSDESEGNEFVIELPLSLFFRHFNARE